MQRHLGLQLVEDLNWRQGVLLPLLSWSTVFLQAQPATDLSRRVVAEGNVPQISVPNIAPHAVAVGVPNGKVSKQRFVVVSQTCDIAKDPEIEPFVVVMKAFTTTNDRIRSSALRDNTRQFVLNPETGLIVDAGVQALIEKPLLASLTPELSNATPETQRRFANWLARRYARAAHPNAFVDAVVRPIHHLLRDLQSVGDPDYAVLEQLHEVRVAIPPERGPFPVRLFFIAPDHAVRDTQFKIRTSSLVGKMRKAIDQSNASIAAWGVFSYDTLPTRVYRETDALSFDEFSYSTGTLSGAEPPSVAM